ncbi:VOC family protein [Gilvimarinus sp. SDUM040013]|uniref:VOC family protein n=1 Tax=Gilvimarinus gilvus TaxID=3058038 RepID=A0ABU4S4S0_9GAMM|nr:VOC family protein [Gilvimarinus sp. SDUM040013]MDO3386908.1 VOC family protein [Gilvimarinus sp. SDUM040013]MDX6851586.1 VOC family protein [Gilvimarinus sp. SDUM040013]
MIERMVPALYVDDLNRSKAFYCDLLDLKPGFEAEWIVQLSDSDNESIELILQPRTHDLVPKAFQKAPQGASIAFVVLDCDELFKRAQSMGLEIIQEPKNEYYGQRRFLTVDPDGLLIDISSSCEPSPEFMEKYFGTESA